MMQLLPSDILADICNLSLPLLITGLLAGLTLWLLGWRTHRFWVVMATSVLAGAYGLVEGHVWQTHPVVAGVFLALTAGILALSLIRLAAFAGGGALGLVLVQSYLPAFHQPLIIFVCCGFLGLLLFRWWFMALASFSGAMLLLSCGLALVSRSGHDILSLADKYARAVSWACIIVAVLGFIVQALLEWRRLRKYGKETILEEIEDPAKVLLSLPNPLKLLWNLRKAA